MNYLRQINEDIVTNIIKSAVSLFRVCDFALIRGKTVYGFNEELSIMKETELDIEIPQFPEQVYISKSTVMKKEGPFYLYGNLAIIHEDDVKELWPIQQIINSASMTINNVLTDLMTMPLTCSVQSIQKDASFAMAILSMTAADGVKYFNYNNHMLSFYTGILPTTKTDDIQMDFFDKTGLKYFLTRFTIKKKTGKYVRVYLRYLRV